MSRYSMLALLCLCLIFGAAQAQAQIDVDCTGGTFPTIQQAVNVSNPGDVIVVHANCSSSPQPINIIGLDNRQIVSADLSQTPPYVGAYSVGPNQSPVPNTYTYDFGQSCIHIQNSNDISIVGLQFEWCVDDGITILGSTHVTIQGLGIWAVGADGIAVRGSRDINISGNFIFGANSPGRFGISVDAASDLVRIQNNRITKNWNGIAMEGRRVHALNNDVSFNIDTGIIVRSDESTVTRNTVIGNAGPQVDFSSMPPLTCVVGNQTNSGIAPWLTGCQGSNT